MNFVYGLLLILLGVLCIPSFVAQKVPKVKGLLDKTASFYHIIGGIVALLGMWFVVVSPTLSMLDLSFLMGKGNTSIFIIRLLTSVVKGILFLLIGLCFFWRWVKNYALSKVSTDEEKTKIEAAFAVTSFKSLAQEVKEASVAPGDFQRTQSFGNKMLFNKLVTFQPKIGIASIIFGVWVIISAIIIR